MRFVGPLEEQFRYLARAINYSFHLDFPEVIDRGRSRSYEPKLPECSNCKDKAWNSYHEVLCPSSQELEVFYRANARSVQNCHLVMVKLITPSHLSVFSEHGFQFPVLKHHFSYF